MKSIVRTSWCRSCRSSQQKAAGKSGANRLGFLAWLAAGLWIGAFSLPAQTPPNFVRINDSAISAVSPSALGAAWGDVDGDGKPDLAFAMVDGSGGIVLRQTAGGFSNLNDTAVNTDRTATVGVAWGDYDNDGDVDLLKANYSDQNESLFRNDGKGGFTRVTQGALATGGGSSQSVIWIDYNRDGLLDAFVLNGGGSANQACQLFKGTLDGAFAKVTGTPLVTDEAYWLGAAWADYDKDGNWDVMLIGGDRLSLYHSLGGDQWGVVAIPDYSKLADYGAHGTSGGAWGDMDNDGDLDYAAATTGNPGGVAVFRNDGGKLTLVNGRLTASSSAGAGFGIVWADFDNDGFLDLLGSNRNGATTLLRGQGDGTFVSINEDPVSARLNPASNAFAIADYDRDGQLDVLSANWPGGSPALFRNTGSANAWLRVQLVGSVSQRQGIGARVQVETVVPGGVRRQFRQIGGEDASGSVEPIAHFGLGSSTNGSLVRVEWPSGHIQVITMVSPRQTLVVNEPDVPLRIIPNGGTFVESIAVVLRSSISASEIHFTLDGSEPGAQSPTYTAPIQITKSTTVKARLFLNGFPVSDVVSAEFTADPGLSFSPAPGLFTNKVDVAMSSRLSNVEIRYTRDGSEPTTTSALFSAPIELREATTIKARAYFNGFPVTDVVSATYLRVYAFDNDGISSAWREQYFGPNYRTDPRAAVDADPDQDQSNNLQEFTVGTDPLDPLSGFKVGVRAVPDIQFQSVVGQKYQIRRRTSLNSAESVVVVEFVATETETHYVDVDAGVVANPAFYIVVPVP
jgi:hypothetical protein